MHGQQDCEDCERRRSSAYKVAWVSTNPFYVDCEHNGIVPTVSGKTREWVRIIVRCVVWVLLTLAVTASYRRIEDYLTYEEPEVKVRIGQTCAEQTCQAEIKALAKSMASVIDCGRYLKGNKSTGKGNVKDCEDMLALVRDGMRRIHELETTVILNDTEEVASNFEIPVGLLWSTDILLNPLQIERIISSYESLLQDRTSSKYLDQPFSGMH